MARLFYQYVLSAENYIYNHICIAILHVQHTYNLSAIVDLGQSNVYLVTCLATEYAIIEMLL